MLCIKVNQYRKEFKVYTKIFLNILELIYIEVRIGC